MTAAMQSLSSRSPFSPVTATDTVATASAAAAAELRASSASASTASGMPSATLVDRVDELVSLYRDLLAQLADTGVDWVQLDEPVLVRDLDAPALDAIGRVYNALSQSQKRPAILVASYFGSLGPALERLAHTGVEGLAVDLVAGTTTGIAGLPELADKLMSIGTYIAATEPLGEERARRLIANNAAVTDINWIIDYFRRSADHRLLFGGRVSYSGIDPFDSRTILRGRMTRVFPELADARIDYAWVATSTSR